MGTFPAEPKSKSLIYICPEKSKHISPPANLPAILFRTSISKPTPYPKRCQGDLNNAGKFAGESISLREGVE